MNEFAASLARIADQARSGALGGDGEWLAAAFEMHLAGAAPIDQAVKLAFASACRRRRDQALREYARL
jgi:hypothetical protein